MAKTQTAFPVNYNMSIKKFNRQESSKESFNPSKVSFKQQLNIEIDKLDHIKRQFVEKFSPRSFVSDHDSDNISQWTKDEVVSVTGKTRQPSPFTSQAPMQAMFQSYSSPRNKNKPVNKKHHVITDLTKYDEKPKTKVLVENEVQAKQDKSITHVKRRMLNTQVYKTVQPPTTPRGKKKKKNIV